VKTPADDNVLRQLTRELALATQEAGEALYRAATGQTAPRPDEDIPWPHTPAQSGQEAAWPEWGAYTMARFRRVFSAAHRLWNDQSKCANIHGHNYVAEVTVRVARLTAAPEFVVPFDAIKTVVDDLDHALILDVADPDATYLQRVTRVVCVMGAPTTENLARVLAGDIAHVVLVENRETAWCRVTVHLQETDAISASVTVRRDRGSM
jgi:6-pyruvoyltetrahydropterin/6-carboxytetrahydropterin synthase